MKFFKLLIFCLVFFFLEVKAIENIKPSYELLAKGGVTDMLIKENKLYVATNASAVNIFNLKTKKLEKTIVLPKIKDFLGDLIDSKIYSLDSLENKILILSQGQKGGRDIFIYENNKLINLISAKDRMFIARAKFINKNTIVFALLSNQVYLYDIKKQKVLKEHHISYSKFSHFALNEKKDKLALADESGEIKIVDTKDLSIIKSLKKENVDNIFQLSFKNNKIISAGQDRRAAFFDLKTNSSYYKQASFLIYSVALSSNGKIAAIAENENNDVLLFNTENKKELLKLVANPATLTNIIFKNENEIYISSDHEKINYYRLKD